MEKKTEKNMEQFLSNLPDDINWSLICKIGIPEEEEKRNNAKISLYLKKRINPQTQEAQK